ncbi:M48 family metallopeptidase [Jannaschia sp. S6380]|uniref:M48 family metallopeptidase n=1 Tax=Jannaschia sp. S6380 TaxID=2926408 RepID=UPI001FF4BDA4|nr:M48 family metallopeptidase [Jannaschia sp. S6380]MCK0169411.1 M48 family metallopeptidase [Jannaschia sp. S6380]
MTFSSSPQIWADYFDGLRATKLRVELSLVDDYRGRSLRMVLPEGHAILWPVCDIRRLPDQAPGRAESYGLALNDLARLIVATPEAKALVAELPHPGRKLPAPPLGHRVALIAGAGTLALAALVFLVLPAMAGVLAQFMDTDAEVAMGQEHYEMTREMFGGPGRPLAECRDPEGVAALDRMVARVTRDVELPYDLKVVVMDDSADPMLNAYAVAGGRITFFESLIRLAESPDEVAAVLAHELGHVVYEDPIRQTLQAASVQAVLVLLVGDLTGGGILTGVAGQAIVSNYSRGAETRADRFAFDQLTKVGLPPSAMASFFAKTRDVWGESEGLAMHFSSHPQLTARIEAATQIGDPSTTAPALNAEDWAALRDICR